jgi:hypothetical protein
MKKIKPLLLANEARHEATWAIGYRDPRILDLDISWRWMVSLTPGLFTTGEWGAPPPPPDGMECFLN